MWALRRLAQTFISACALYLTTGAGAWALDFRCVEASRYKNLLQVFDDNPAGLRFYFGLDGSAMPDLNACRAIAVTGTIRNGDSAVLINAITQNKGWLDVLYLSFDGAHLYEEVKLAQIIRGFRLKTRVLQSVLRYEPDFATHWGPLAAGANATPGTPAPALSQLNSGMEAFARRNDLRLPIAPARNACIESCIGAWIAGVNRLLLPTPPIAPRRAAAVPEMVTAWPRSALAASLDLGTVPATDDAIWKTRVVPGAAPVVPPSAERLLRSACSQETIAGETLESRVGNGADQLARNDFRGVRSTPPAILKDIDSLRRAAVRLQRCVARAYERERLAAFRKFCGSGCDKGKLAEMFDQTAKDFLESNLALSKIAGRSDKLGRLWRDSGPTGPRTWTRREADNVYESTWKLRDGRESSGTLEFARTGDHLVGVRVQAEGRCLYQGTIAADDKSARGTFACTWYQGVLAWGATIEE